MLQLPTAQELPRKLGEEEIATLTGECGLAAERDAVILAHNYQLPSSRTWPTSSATRSASPGRRRPPTPR